MNTPREMEIIGGGLAGLSLGLALRRENVPVTLREAGDYPRHRVCGEFITGLQASTIATLGLSPFLADALPCARVAWYRGDALLRRHILPEPARALSRYFLDTRMAAAFVKLGGNLMTGTAVHANDPAPGRVFTLGKRLQASSPWLGLKIHAKNLPLTGDLELHLGTQAYVGLCQLRDDTVNVCGLFRREAVSAERGDGALLISYLRHCGLTALAERLEAAERCEGTQRAVAGLDFSRTAWPRDRVSLGDSFTQTPPFTGNGMAMAFQSAECAVEPLLQWAHRRAEWPATVALIQQRLRARFRRRLAVARSLHSFLLIPGRQRWLAGTHRRGWLPMTSLYRWLH